MIVSYKKLRKCGAFLLVSGKCGGVVYTLFVGLHKYLEQEMYEQQASRQTKRV